MVKDHSVVTWDEAIRGFVLHKRATRAQQTARWYETYSRSLLEWANQQRLPLSAFTKRHLDEYLVYRTEQGRAASTLHHDALVATVFTEWCKKNDLLDRDPLQSTGSVTLPRPTNTCQHGTTYSVSCRVSSTSTTLPLM